MASPGDRRGAPDITMFGGGPGPWRQDPPWNGWWGDGERLLENGGDLKVQQVRAIEAPGVTHIEYRVANGLKDHPA